VLQLLVVLLLPVLAEAGPQQDGPRTLASAYLAGMGLAAGTIPHQGNACHDIDEVVLELSSGQSLASAKAMGMPMRRSGPQGETITRKPEDAVVLMRFDLAVAQGTCGSNGPADVPNCCNYERIMEGKVWVGRSYRVVSHYADYRFWPNIEIEIPGTPFTIPVPDEVKNILRRLFLIGEHLELGAWTVVGGDTFLVNLCNCDGKYEGKITFKYPKTPGATPSPPAPPAIGPGDEYGDKGVGFPFSPGSHPPLPECTASNDWATGTGAWFVVWSVTKWDYEERLVCVGLDDKCKPIWGQKKWHYASEIEMVATLAGDLSCRPKPVTGDSTPHASHADCTAGCALEPTDSSISTTYTRTIQLTPVMGKFVCQSVAGQGLVDELADYTAIFVTDVGQTNSSSTSLCACTGEGGIIEEEPVGDEVIVEDNQL
jgi:hypothetical protein